MDIKTYKMKINKLMYIQDISNNLYRGGLCTKEVRKEKKNKCHKLIISIHVEECCKIKMYINPSIYVIKIINENK